MSMNSRQLVSVTILGLVFTAGSVQAKDIFVAPDGSDGNTGATTSAALRTIAAASSKAVAGDRVLLMPGRYLEQLRPTRSGQAGAPITYKSYGPGAAIISAASGSSLKDAILVNGVSYIVIDGIDVDGVALRPNARVQHFATITNARYVTIRNGEFRYAHGWHGIGVKSGSSYVTIENNYVEWVGSWDAGSGEDKGSDVGDSIVVDSTAQRVLIQGNKLRHGGHNLINVQGSYCVIQDNDFNNDWRDVISGDAGQRNGEFKGQNLLVQRNIFAGARPSADSANNPIFKVEGNANVARFNVAYDSVAYGVSSSANAKNDATRLRIYNNTFYKLGAAGWRLERFDGAIGQNSFVNNLIVNSCAVSGCKADTLFKVSSAGLGPTANSTMFGNIVWSSGGVAPRILLEGFDGVVSLSGAQSKYPSYFWQNASGAVKFKASAPRVMSDFDLQADSTGVDDGQFLTKTTGSGTSNRLPVQDARYFLDGLGLIAGDLIQLQGSTKPVRVVGVDYSANTLTLSESVQFSSGQGVSTPFSGARPDVGAREISGGAADEIAPLPPTGLAVN
jgi:hypothetical protein